jgi:diphosphomevalonate decarboxylase
MHAVMMTSEPPARYLTPTTSAVLAWVRSQRTGRAARVEGARSGDDGAPAGIRAFFTLDAGPNVHLLCHPGDATALSAAVRQAFPGVSALVDRTGAGPLLTKESSP